MSSPFDLGTLGGDPCGGGSLWNPSSGEGNHGPGCECHGIDPSTVSSRENLRGVPGSLEQKFAAPAKGAAEAADETVSNMFCVLFRRRIIMCASSRTFRARSKGESAWCRVSHCSQEGVAPGWPQLNLVDPKARICNLLISVIALHQLQFIVTVNSYLDWLNGYLLIHVTML